MKTISAAVASALLFSSSYAAGLGKLTVLSSLGQPLRAEIELTSVSKDELGALSARLASPDTFRQANIDYNAALASLRFAVEQRGDRPVIRVTSSQPLNEPFVDMLLEVSGPNGRLVREYTFLLDPADLRTAQSAQVAPATVGIPDTASRTQQQARPAQPASDAAGVRRENPASVVAAPAAPRAARTGDTAAAATPGDYQVRSGDTLARIAGRVKPSGVSLDQMLVALYRANPDAFVGENMNRLKAGQILSVPGEDAVRAVSSGEARGIVVAQAADFNNYRSKLAGQVAASAAQKSGEGRQTAGGKINAKVEEQSSPAAESRDKLKLSNAMPAAGAGSSADQRSGGSVEDRIAQEKAIAEANMRVKELEKNVSELQKLLEIKNKALAEQQSQAQAPLADAGKAAAAGTAALPKAGPEANAPAAPATPATPAASATPSTPAAASAPEASAPATATAEKPAATPAEASAASEAPAAPAAAKAKPVTPPPPPPEPSFLESLTENPLVLPGVGALLVALGALGIYRARRKKESKPFEDSLISDSSLKANSLFGSTGGQTVDTNNSVFNSSFTPSASQLDSNEVDPVAEADVYIAYGRDAQAEEILKEALRTQPERHAVRVKLLEIYSNRKDLRAFEVLATELYGLTKGEGPEWEQAVALGVAIDPNNPLYAGSNSHADVKPESGLVAPTRPLEEQGLATLLSATQSDNSTLQTIDSLETDTSYFSNTGMSGDISEDVKDLKQEGSPDEPAAGKNELDFEPMTDMDIGMDAIPEAKAETETPKTMSSDLDFDLDGLNLSPPTLPQTPASAAEPLPEMSSIDFDFLDTPSADKDKPAGSFVPAAAENVAAADPSIDDLPDFELKLPSEAAAPADPIELPGIKDLDFSLDDVASDTGSKADAKADEPFSLDIGQPANPAPLNLDIPELADISDEPAPAAAKPADDPLDFDLSGISLELNPKDAETRSDFDLHGLSDLNDLSGSMDSSGLGDLDVSINSAEMETKLDLAIAYQEIGDKEGARELLDEVLKGGTPEQSERAKSLLVELA
ncbi:FimV/HubP family polar landmark protein [Noviherbaspirillum sp. CPCC 100848]|uniref:FimV/HubP family polar landmark protein n=1 Tax=Noviherbaspirillum album TaxID=3080276 RepID=A0ABU6JBN3_9BURK|nr:FimV/HubP family polar landmark protein [Noviherbaspirillum sp. CPCC 100848]MEC4721055.1 FimV/HubP family polar landmark protein [Noviherbaspirillum sp. CPCC 100848]